MPVLKDGQKLREQQLKSWFVLSTASILVQLTKAHGLTDRQVGNGKWRTCVRRLACGCGELCGLSPELRWPWECCSGWPIIQTVGIYIPLIIFPGKRNQGATGMIKSRLNGIGNSSFSHGWVCNLACVLARHQAEVISLEPRSLRHSVTILVPSAVLQQQNSYDQLLLQHCMFSFQGWQ